MQRLKQILNKLINPNTPLLFFYLLLFSIPVLLPLFKNGMFISDDGSWMIVRLSDFNKSLKNGLFPVRWGERLNYGYGYPVFNFLYPGVLYLGEIIHLLHFNFINSIKILFGLSILFSGFFSFLWLKSVFNKIFPSVIGAIVYLYAPYHLFDLYKRGSLGEITAFAWIPLVLFSLEKRNILLGSFSFALLILSHNTLAIIFLPIILIYSAISKDDKKVPFLIFLFGTLISSFFWIPALHDRQYTIFDNIAVSNWKEFFLVGQNFSLLGWGSLIIFIIALICFYENKNKKTLLFLLSFTVSIFLSIPISSYVWQISFLPKLIQFPWRFLSIAVLSSSFLAAFVISNFGKGKIIFSCLIISIFFFSSLRYINNIKYLVVNEGYFSTNEDTTTVKNEYMPIWVKNFPTSRALQKAELLNGVGNIKTDLMKSNKILITSNLKTDGKIKINTVYFPGWYAKVDGKEVQIEKDNPKGVIIIPVSAGKYRVEIYWQETPIRLISDLISFSALIVLIIFSIYKNKNNHLAK